MFFAGGTKFAIVRRVVFANIFSVVYNVPAHTRHTSDICNSAGTLVFSSVANGAFCGGRDIFFSSRATFTIVHRVVLFHILAVV
jgi:hypothetical protein